ncbi:MAG: hypothetical protein CM1200mP20_15200 [Pseudomonadota bacterium]|nr:MAG: hypothetical protein CM1200mP20_15200 [Pseudomonadota bacterium]
MKYFTSGVLDTQMTGGSITLLAFFGQFRKMGAAAREMLRLAAAEQWGTPIDQCRAAEGKITNTQSGNPSNTACWPVRLLPWRSPRTRR